MLLVVGAAAFCALGLAVTALIPNTDAAGPIVNATILPLLFLGTPFHWTDVLVVAAWGVGGLLVAVRSFSWEHRTKRSTAEFPLSV